MITYEKAKRFANNFFEWFEVGMVNCAMKNMCLWRLKHKYTLEADYMTSEFRQEVVQYWNQYTKKFKPDWHKYYSSRNGVYDVRYIPDDLYYTVIDQHFNNRKYGWGVNDKNYYKLWFSDVKQPITVVSKINGILYDSNYKLISLEEAIMKCSANNKLIIKPAVETGGSKGISFWNKNDGVNKLEELLIYGQDNIIVQEIIIQHDILSEIHPDSINTIRIMSLLFKNKVHILSSVLRMGIDGSKVDNASAGGITCGIKENGQLKEVAYSAHGIKYDKHPQGYTFNQCIIPSYNKVLELVRKQHVKMGHFRLISWDIAIGADGEPILIEANLRNGECDFHQFNNGPLFGDLTEEVLEEVFNKKR